MTAPYSSSRFAYEGTETTETAIVRTGGAEDPTGQAQSRKIVTSANIDWLRPFRCEPWAIWNETTGADVTVTVHGMYAGSSLDNCDVWLECEYQGDVSSTLGKIVTTTRSNVLATCTPLALTGSAWANAQFGRFAPSTLVNAVLSNIDQTITHTTTGTNSGGTGLTFASTGKIYFEVTTLATFASTTHVFGLITSSGNLSSMNTNFNNLAVHTSSGSIVTNGAGTGASIGGFAVGDIAGFALDLDARKFWVRRNIGPWNNNVSADPVTGAGGLTLYSTVGYAIAAFFSGSTSSGSSFTFNCGQAAFVNGPPTGYSGFPSGWSDFSLVATLNSPQPGRPGLIHVRPKIGKASATIYLDPQIELTPASTTALMVSTHKSSRYAYEGTETTETSIVRSGGTAHSRKIVTTANAQWLRPYRAEPYAVWNETTGADVTVTVYGMGWNGGIVGGIKNDWAWMDAEYLGDVSSTLGKIVTTTKANVLATAALNASDSSVWAAPPPVTFDGPLIYAVASPTIVLSDGNLTVTKTALQSGAVSNISMAMDIGKFYFEIKHVARFGTSNSQIGLTASRDITADPKGIYVIPGGATYIYVNAVSVSPDLGAIATGIVYRYAIDFTNRLVWIARGGGNWNGNASANPATGVGGFSMSPGISYTPGVYLNTSSTGEVYTANFGASAYTYTPPTDYLNWGDLGNWDTFKLVATLNGVATPPPSPAAMPALTGLIGWWDASVTASLTLTGSNIDAVADQSGAGNNLSWYGWGKPTYSATGFNSRPAFVLNGTGVGSAFRNASFPLGTGNTLTCWWVGNLNTATVYGNGGIFSYTGAGQTSDFNNANSFLWMEPGTSTTQLRVARNSVNSDGTCSANVNHRVILTINSSGVQTMYVDGIAQTLGTVAGNWTSPGVLFIGRDYSGNVAGAGNYWSGPIAEVGIATGFSDATTVAALDAYLRDKWIEAPTAPPVVNPQPGQPGLINVRVKAGKASATYYIDPTPVLT